MAFRIRARAGGEACLEADARLHPGDFHAIAARLRQTAVRARKIGYVAARQAQHAETVETRWNGLETTNTARPGDWIVTALSPARDALRDRNGSLNTYVVAPDRFASLYEPTGDRTEHGAVFRAMGVVDALRLPGGFDIVAPWNERQQAPDGYLILNGEDVYGNNAETFAATYEVQGG